MSLAGWLGTGGAMLALLLAIQSLRVRSLRRDLQGARQAASDARDALEEERRRHARERHIAERYTKKITELNEKLKREVAWFVEREEEAGRRLKEIEDAHGDDDATIAVLRDALRRERSPGSTVPKWRSGDGQGGDEDPV